MIFVGPPILWNMLSEKIVRHEIFRFVVNVPIGIEVCHRFDSLSFCMYFTNAQKVEGSTVAAIPRSVLEHERSTDQERENDIAIHPTDMLTAPARCRFDDRWNYSVNWCEHRRQVKNSKLSAFGMPKASIAIHPVYEDVLPSNVCYAPLLHAPSPNWRSARSSRHFD